MKAAVRSGPGLYGRRRRREMLVSSRSVSPREGATGGGGGGDQGVTREDPEVASRSLSRPPREGGGSGGQGITALLRRSRRLERIKGERRRGIGGSRRAGGGRVWNWRRCDTRYRESKGEIKRKSSDLFISG